MQEIRKQAGEIQWKDDAGRTHWAEFYHSVPDTWGYDAGLPYEIYFHDAATYRWAKILKTVVHIAVDEDAQGKPLFETWTKVKVRFFPA